MTQPVNESHAKGTTQHVIIFNLQNQWFDLVRSAATGQTDSTC